MFIHGIVTKVKYTEFLHSQAVTSKSLGRVS